ncbi:MAG: 1-acyl-sn-glycerol-3-phosphate acyltransferase, partial [Pseudomonadota bacterium]|nr:1-acyl-sn-glycerol-3-phosphate acyltransferase [Pseudomonadota bacterium]
MRSIRSVIFVIWLYGWMAILGVVALPALLLPRAAMLWFIRALARTTKLGFRWIFGIHVEL